MQTLYERRKAVALIFQDEVRPIGSLLSEKEAALIIGCDPSTLRKWRLRGVGPQYRKIGTRMIRYEVNDLRAFFVASARGSTSDSKT